MTEINEAYRVLGDEKSRSAYDATRKKGDYADYRSAESEESSQAFNAALGELEDRWKLAVEIFPDLKTLRESLARISTSLAFGFVTVLLESKKYNHRIQIATELERQFLQRYFGTNDRVLEYARELIQAGHREAARSLNKIVDVMGSEIDPALVLQRIERQYAVNSAAFKREAVESLAKSVRNTGYFTEACQLAKLLGYTVAEHSTGFLGSNLNISVTSPMNAVTRFKSTNTFVEWVKLTLCP
jgi:curved DNA-binding protein CbpA